MRASTRFAQAVAGILSAVLATVCLVVLVFAVGTMPFVFPIALLVGGGVLLRLDRRARGAVATEPPRSARMARAA